jgi:hypothetical protein
MQLCQQSSSHKRGSNVNPWVHRHLFLYQERQNTGQRTNKIRLSTWLGLSCCSCTSNC